MIVVQARCNSRLAFLLTGLMSIGAAWQATAQETPEQEAAGLQEQAKTLHASGQFQQGIQAATRALALREQAKGKDHADLAPILLTLGLLYQSAGNYPPAEAAYLRALAINESARGPEHPDTAKALTDLANLYVFTAEYTKAVPLYERGAAINEKVLGADHFETSRSLIGLANVYAQTAEYGRAEPLYQRVLTLRERLMGSTHASVASVLIRLASMYYYMGSYARAKPLYQRALAIREQLSGPDHPETAFAIGNVAIAHAALGEYVEAEALYKRTLTICEKTVGLEHPNTARASISLANLYANTGAYQQAEPLYKRAIAIQRRVESGASDVALSLANLGTMYLWSARPAQAEPLFREALSLREAALGAKHPSTAKARALVADSYADMGEYSRAESLYRSALVALESAPVAVSDALAVVNESLAALHVQTGAYGKALPFAERAVSLFERNLGPEHFSVAKALHTLGVIRWARGENQQALALLQRAQRIQTRNAERFLLAVSESRKQGYMKSLADYTGDDVSFAVSMGAAGTEFGITSVLRYKGRVLDAASDTQARIHRSVTAADHGLLDELADITSQLSSLTYAQGADLSAEQYRKRLAQLAARQEQLEADLAGRNQTFSREITPVTLDNVRRAIPANAALVEWFRYAPLDLARKNSSTLRGAPRYVAYVLKRSSAPVAIDVGEAQAVEALVRRLRTALNDPSTTDVKLRAAALSQVLLAPLRQHLRDVSQLLLSPDGELNLVPMAALLDESGAYLVGRYDVSYLTSGRDLLRIAASPAPPTARVVVAAPDFGKLGDAVARATLSIQPQRAIDMDRSGLQFRPLPGAALEAGDLKNLLQLKEDEVLLGRGASESNLKQLKGPLILHIASHGFFLSDQQLTREMTRRRSIGELPIAPGENPLLRSGIALAGANERTSGKDDGILTALEATQLDLNGTELVVLSACDSGVGEIQNGEGVYGLRRALELAGAQTQVTSLWKVSDQATRTLMVDYYQHLLQGEGRAAALRRAQRDMLANPAFAHPYYWASFIPIGNWNPLSRAAPLK